MITFLHGKLVEALPTQVTVNVNGVGYEALIPLSSYDKLPALGQEVKLLTHLVVREDAHTLYGFMSAAERDLFRLLINTVSGIGPKIALNVLSGISVAAFRGAVANGDADFVGYGRLVLSYPEFAADVLNGRTLKKNKICRTFSDCTTAPRLGLVSGCFPLDEYYRGLPDYKCLVDSKKQA